MQGASAGSQGGAAMAGMGGAPASVQAQAPNFYQQMEYNMGGKKGMSDMFGSFGKSAGAGQPASANPMPTFAPQTAMSMTSQNPMMYGMPKAGGSGMGYEQLMTLAKQYGLM